MCKLKILFLIGSCFIFGNKIKAQDTAKFNGMRDLINHITHVFKDNHPELSFFKYHLISTDGNIYDWYNGKNDGTDTTTFMLDYLKTVKDLELSNYNQNDNAVSIKTLERNMITHLQNGLTPISLSFVEYSDFKDSTILLNLIDWQNNQFTETKREGYYPFEKKKFFSASALNHVIKIPQFNFYIDDSLIQSNIRNKIDSIFINFGDAMGFIPIQKGNLYQVNYNTPGLKNCVVKLKSDTNYFYSTFQIYDSTQVSSLAKSVAGCSAVTTLPHVGPIAISVTIGGKTVKGRYAVWYSLCNTARKIRKPFIICTGFNPGNGKQLVKLDDYPNDITVNVDGTSISIPVTIGWRGTYYETYNGTYNKRFSETEESQCGPGASNHNQYLDRLRDEGYDVIIVMNDNGTDYIENNAILLEGLITDINRQKLKDKFYFENVVSGYSAGGLSARLALANMEYRYRQGIGDHPHTKLFVSVESENQGANVPLGLQYLLDFQANSNNLLPSFFGFANANQGQADFVNQLVATIAQSFNTNATANELTLYTTASPNGPSTERLNLLNAYNSIPGSFKGYPTFVRRVGAGQGSSVGSQIPHSKPELFKSQLKFNPLGDTYTKSDCKGSYTIYRPVSIKTTVARWWGSINSQNIFDGNVHINANWTYGERICISKKIFGVTYCGCIGPFVWAGQNTTIADQHIAKPTVTTNFDDVPSSTQSAHIELYKGSAYGFYNNWFAGNSFADYDPSLHGFAPTASCLDLHDPGTEEPLNNFRSPALAISQNGLDLMNINDKTGVLNQQADKRYGFPYLKYPDNHYVVTPYDAVFAIGINNGTYSDGTTPKPDNQFHVEDPQIEMGDYLARVEVAPTNLFISNQTIGASASTYAGYGGGYMAEFEARNKIIVGKTDLTGANIYSMYNNQNYLTPNGDVTISIGTTAIFHSGEEIAILPGFGVPWGAGLEIYPEYYNCSNLLYRVNNGSKGGTKNTATTNLPYKGFDYEKPLNKTADKKINSFLLYPNPNNGSFTYVNVCDEPTSQLVISDLSGKQIYTTTIQNNNPVDLDLTNLTTGFYIAKVINKNSSDAFKLTINR